MGWRHVLRIADETDSGDDWQVRIGPTNQRDWTSHTWLQLGRRISTAVICYQAVVAT